MYCAVNARRRSFKLMPERIHHKGPAGRKEARPMAIEKLIVPNTPRLDFVCGEVDYDSLFKDVTYAGTVTRNLDEIFRLPEGARQAAIQESIRQLEANIQFIKAHVAPKEADPNLHVAVYAEARGGEPVGRVVINYLTTAHPSIDVRVLPEKQRQGYGYEMLSAVVRAAFEQYGMDHLEYDLLCKNEPSRRLVRKLNGERVYWDGVGEMYELYPFSIT